MVNRIAMYLWDSPNDLASNGDLSYAVNFLEEVIESLRIDCIIALRSYCFSCDYAEWAIDILTEMQGDLKHTESLLALSKTELDIIAALAEQGFVSPELVLAANALAEQRKQAATKFSKTAMKLASKLHELVRSINNLAD